MIMNSTTTAQATEVARAAYAAFATGDVPAVLALLDPQVEWTEAAGGPYGGRYLGPQAVLEGVFGRIARDWTGFAVEPQTYLGEAGTAVVIGTYRGTSVATGKAMSARFAHIWEVRDGRTVRWEQVVDSATQNAALT